MSRYIVASNGKVMGSIKYYKGIKDVWYSDMVYVDQEAAVAEGKRFVGPRMRGKRIGPPEPPEHKAGTVHPSRTDAHLDSLEAEIHKAVIRYISTEHSYISSFIVPGIGEYRGNASLRITDSGYVKGQPDIMIPVGNGRYTGLCIELKKYSNSSQGRGKLSKEQADVLNKYASIGYKTLVSCDIGEVTDTIDDYMAWFDLVRCSHCKSSFLNYRLLEIHLKDYHKIEK